MKIGVCIRAKDEQKIINDWVKHYIDLGFDRIIIYDNMSNPSIEETLNCINNYNKDIIHIHIDKISHSNQPPLYQQCVDNNKDLDWLLICDADEFLWHKDKNIKAFLSQFSEDTCTILINWLVYGTSNLNIYDTSKSVFEQFIKREDYSNFWNRFVKSFIRPKLIDKIGNVHITMNLNYKIKNIYNENIIINDYPNQCDNIDSQMSNNTNILIVHYMTLDYESMLQKYYRNRNGCILFENDTKYSLEWYNNNHSGFKDNNIDLRMCN
jgi:hypothetical protein